VAVVSGRTAAFAVLLALGGVRATGAAPSARPTEYEVKAAFLYNFAKFVEWPGEAGSRAPIVVGVLGEDPFGPVLERTIGGRRAQERPVVARRLTGPEEAETAQIVFVGSSEDRRLQGILAALEGHGVLTVSEMERFAERGGMVGFRTEENRVHFDVNLRQVTRAGLRINAQVLRLARIVGPR
jgi:hypothetical protein